jgi:5-methylcytosine-specific restriction endonuclease McrA
MKPMSERRRAEREEREIVREAALASAGFRCSAPGVGGVRCSGPLDVDEIIPRGVRPGGHLEQDNVQVLCRAHHDWKHANPREAVAAGLRRWSWDTDSPEP